MDRERKKHKHSTGVSMKIQQEQRLFFKVHSWMIIPQEWRQANLLCSPYARKDRVIRVLLLSANFWFGAHKGGEGGSEPPPPFLADMICEQPLTNDNRFGAIACTCSVDIKFSSYVLHQDSQWSGTQYFIFVSAKSDIQYHQTKILLYTPPKKKKNLLD